MASSAPPARSPRTRRRVLRRIGAGALVLVLILGLATYFYYRHLNGNLQREEIGAALGDNRPEPVYVGDGNPLNILVLGTDTRAGAGNDIDGESGMGGSDTTLLLHLSADRTRAYGVSIPRDSIVDRPACGVDDEILAQTQVMWNDAYRVGHEREGSESAGAACTQRQFEALTGVRVDNYLVVDFRGFTAMVDALDGVPMCIPEDIDDPEHGIHIKAGENRTLHGDEARDYIRARYIGPLAKQNDLSRIQRQQTFLVAMIDKAMSTGMLVRIDRLTRFLNAATESLTTDFDSVGELAQLGMQVRGIGLDQVKFVTVPNEYFPRDSEHWGKVRWTPGAKGLWAALAKDDELPRALGRKSIRGDQQSRPRGERNPDQTPGLCG